MRTTGCCCTGGTCAPRACRPALAASSPICASIPTRPRRGCFRAPAGAEPLQPMFDDASRAELRRTYLAAWRKLSARLPLEPLEAQIAAVIEAHPEYVPLLEQGEAALAAEFTPQSGRENPFLHMGMHLAIRDQVGTNRPHGIASIHAR